MKPVIRNNTPLRRALCAAVLLATCSAPAFAARFSYHGELTDGEAPAQGRFDLRLRAFATPDAKSALGEAVELANVEVRDGGFAVELDLPEARSGDTFVQVAVRRAGSADAFAILGAPQPIAKVNTGCWALDGNAPVPAGSFLGIADPASPQPLVLKARNAEVASLLPLGTPSAFGNAPALRFGSSANVADSRGATVGGGGASRDPTGSDCPDCGNAATADFATVAGGLANTASAPTSTASGGRLNSASGNSSTVAGGLANTASGHAAAVAGGQFNTAGGEQSFVAAGAANCAGGDQSFVAGVGAKTRHGNESGDLQCSGIDDSGDANGDEGSFVWADPVGGDFVSSGPNQFLVRADDGVSINTAPPDATVEFTIASNGGLDYPTLWLKQKTASNAGVILSAGDATAANNDSALYVDHYNGTAQFRRLALNNDGSVVIRSSTSNSDAGVRLAPGAGAWSSLSDRRVKTAIDAIDPRQVLDKLVDLPLSTWSYIAQGEDVRHLGPMAQDFAAAFGLGEDDTHISSIDADGVALAAIQGLNAKLERENAAVRAENAALRQQFAAVLERLARLEADAAR